MKLFGNILKWLGITVYAACAVTIIIFLTPIGGWKALNVLTGSMKPTIQPGALVLIHREHLRDLRVGDVATYQSLVRTDATITHRIVKIQKVKGVTTVTFKGDANRKADPPIPGGFILGKAALVVPGAGHYINYLHNPYGLAALVIIPGLIVIWSEIRRLRRALARPAVKESAHAQPGPPPGPPIPPAPRLPVTPARRSLDGMRSRHMVTLILVIIVLLSAQVASASHVVGKVSLTHNRFTAVPAAITVPRSRDDCKEYGWKKYKNADGTRRFRNQGQCIAFVESNSHSHHHSDSDGDYDDD